MLRDLRSMAGLLASLLFAVVWAYLAAGSPSSTFHFAPMIVAGAWVAFDGSVGAGLTQRRVVNTSLGGLGVAAVTIALLAAKGDLDGPTFWNEGGGWVLVEHGVFAVLGAVLGGAYAVRVAARPPRDA